ncbi:MAG: HepT-like ribonuclease domain-containing protein [Campylobacterota bacterium]|nr:HepT-like ribonuclease domain-containing protein [Campylobacterota bacterium]
MYNENELVRIQSIHKKLISISTIIKRHDGIVKALEDEDEGQPAILMLLVAIAEQFNKLKKINANILTPFDKVDVKGMIDVRNFISHDYDGVSLGLVEDSLRFDIPRIVKIVENILEK